MRPKPQALRWSPTRKTAKVDGGGLIPWEKLQGELEKLFTQVPNMPLPVSVKTKHDSDPLKRNWHIVGTDANGSEVARIWIGHNPEKAGGPWEGGVYIANPSKSEEVWAVFLRYSDGSYRRQEHPGPPPFCYSASFKNGLSEPMKGVSKAQYEALLKSDFDLVVNELEFTYKAGNKDWKSISSLSPTQAMMIWILFRAVLEQNSAIHH